MTKNNEKEEIINLCKKYYDYENFLNYDHNDTHCRVFLIEKELMDNFKKNVYYEQLKDSIKKDIDLKHIDKNILNKLKKVQKSIVQIKLNNKQELINELETGKIFYVITATLFNYICKEDKKNEKGIDALLQKRIVRLFFKEKKEQVNFKYNEDGTIGKSNIIDKSHRKIVFKEDLSILIELYYFHKILKAKENTTFKELNDEEKETVYLINNKWIQNYKSFFKYKDLENELMNIDNKNSVDFQSVYITENFIDKKLSSLSDSFIEKINKNINKINFGKVTDEKKKLEKPDVHYLVNIQIINSRIYKKLTELNYEGCDSNVKKCDYYLVGNQKILLLFDQGIGKDKDEIGYINNENIFIPEYLLVYDNVSKVILNQFFKNKFINFKTKNQIYECDILDLNNSKVGQCYKLDNISENHNSEQTSHENSDAIKTSNTEGDGCGLNGVKTQNNIPDINNDKNGTNDITLSIIQFNEELSKKIKNPMTDGNIINDGCYLIKKDWLEKLMENSNNLDKNCIIKDSLSDLSSIENNIFYPKDFCIINKDIYQKLCENNIINKEENAIPTKYIINNGKLILEHEYKINNNVYNILICKQNEDNSFKTEIIINFENNKNERDKEFENLKKNKNTQYNLENCKVVNAISHIGLFRPINEKKEKEKKINKYIEILASLYFHNEDLKNKTTRPLIGSQIENYFIISKKWMEKFMEKFKYEKFYEIINHKIKEILNNNENAKFSSEDNISNEILEKMCKLFEKEDFLNDIIKDDKLLEELRNKELYSINVDNIENNFNNLSIINERIKNLIKEMFQVECEEKQEFILGDEKIIIKFKSKNQNHIIEGKFNSYDNKNSFVKEKSINYNNNKNSMDEKFNNYIQLSQNKKISDDANGKGKVENLNIIQTNSLKSGNKNSNNLDHEKDSRNPIIDSSNIDIDRNNNAINNNMNNTQNHNDNNNQHNNNNIGMNIKKVIGNKEEIKDNNNNQVESTEYSRSNINKEEIKDNNNTLNNNESSPNNNNIELEKFTKEQIKILILYYFFIEELKNNNKQFQASDECYTIKKDYMREFQKFYLYNDLVQEIQRLLSDNNIKDNNTNKEELILNNLNNNYLKKIKLEESNYPKDTLDNIDTAQVKFKQEQNLIYPDNFEIINKNIYKKIIKRKDNITFDFGKKEYLINEGKIILKLDYPKSKNKIFEIIVGTIDKKNNTFISNYLYKYKDQNGMNAHYKYLTTKTLTEFKLNNISKTNQKELLIGTKNNGNNNIGMIGIIHILNEIEEEKNNNKLGQQLSSNENNQIIKKEPEKELMLNKQIINNIKFLTRFYLFYEDLKKQTKESNSSHKEYEKGYMINEKLFKLYTNFYEYNKLKDILDKNNKIKLEIKQNKNLSIDKNIDEFSNELIKNIPKDLKEKYFNGFNEFIELIKNNELYSATLKRYNHKEFLYFDSCILVKENLIKLISMDNPEIQKSINNSKVNFLITDKKIIIQLNLILNVGFINKDYIYNPEIIFLCSGEESLNTILNEIRILGYNNVLKKIKIKEKNVATYNNNNSILVLFINEKLITAENYSSNKKNNNQTKNPINPNTQIKPKGNQKPESKENRKMKLNNVDRFGSIGSETQKKEELNIPTKNMILAMIDSEKIKIKSNFSLNANNNKFNKYYLLNLEWFLTYKNLYNLNNLYNQLINNKIIEKIVYNDLTSPNEKLIEKVMPFIDSIYKNTINKNNSYWSNVKSENVFNAKYEEIKINKEKAIKNYIGFIIVSEETIKSLAKEFSFRYNNNSCECAFGDNKIFVKIINNNQTTIEIGNICNEKNIFTSKFLFDYSNKSDLNYSESELLRVGYRDYIKFNLLFNNDITSPIFDAKGNIIGDAIFYNYQIKDYSIYQINAQLKSMIKLYFNYSQLRYSGKEIKQREYYLFNSEFLKKYKIDCNYELIEDALNANNNIKDVFNGKEEINDKKLTIIIKNALSEINTTFNEQETSNNSQNINEGEPYFDMENSSNLMYYNNFEMININLIEKSSPLNQNQDYKCTCFFISNYVLIILPKKLNNNYNCIVVVGKINSDNLFNASYLMKYKDINSFTKYLQYINNEFGFDIFVESLIFNNGSFLPLNDANDNLFGKIYNLENKGNNNNLPNNNNNINYNINNINNPPNIQQFTNQKQNNKKINGKNAGNNNKKGNKNKAVSPPQTPPPSFKSIKEEYPFHQKIALRNVGATCNMNATLQCLCNIEKLVSYFKYHQNIEKFIQSHGRDSLTYSFKYLIENLWQSHGSKYILPKYNGGNCNNKYFSPIEFKDKLAKMNPLFRGIQTNDSKDLVNFIIMTLHEELNKINKNINLSYNNQIIDQRNHDMVLQNFIQKFNKENKSIITDIFYAINGNFIKCLNCNEYKYDFQTYFFLIFPLEEIWKFKIQKYQSQFNLINNNSILNKQNISLIQSISLNINTVNIDDCFQYNTMECFNKENTIYCNRCKKQTPFSISSKLYTTPEILIIILNREKNSELDIKLQFNEKINLFNYVQMKNYGYIYDLIGVVCQFPDFNLNENLISCIKSPIDSQWYSYKDDIVYKVYNFKKQIKDNLKPYILFYQKVN